MMTVRRYIACTCVFVILSGCGSAQIPAKDSSQSSNISQAEWKTFHDPVLNIDLEYPPTSNISGSDASHYSDPSLEGQRGIGISAVLDPIANIEFTAGILTHDQNIFFNPPAGADVEQWVADMDMSSPRSGALEFPNPKSIQISGKKTLHIVETASNQIDDKYYVISGRKMYKVTTDHRTPENAEAYKRFLESIKLPE